MQPLTVTVSTPIISRLFKPMTYLLLLSTFLLTACNTEPSKPEVINHEGLLQINNSSLDELAIRPDTDFTVYEQIRFLPIALHYSDRRRTRSPIFRDEDYQFDDKENSRFNEKIIKAVSKQWAKHLGWKTLASLANNHKPDDNNLSEKTINIEIIIDDFELIAPIKNDQPFSYQSFADKTSEFNVQLKLIDAKTGTLLLSSKDKRETERISGTNRLDRVSGVRYWSDTHHEFSSWSRSISSAIKKQSL